MSNGKHFSLHPYNRFLRALAEETLPPRTLTGTALAIALLDRFDGTPAHAVTLQTHLRLVGRDRDARRALVAYEKWLDTQIARGTCSDADYARYEKINLLRD